MKSFLFLLFFSAFTLFEAQAQSSLTVIISNHSDNPWVYKLSGSANSFQINQTFAAGATVEYTFSSSTSLFPLYWGAQDVGQCYEKGMHSEPGAPMSTAFECTGGVLSQSFAASSNGEYYLFVEME